jgi:hypothetical protein
MEKSESNRSMIDSERFNGVCIPKRIYISWEGDNFGGDWGYLTKEDIVNLIKSVKYWEIRRPRKFNYLSPILEEENES